jgi:DNA repair exonuclease SbcCD nuclease subunit
LDDDWLETQRTALAHVAEYAKNFEADVVAVGDIFHSTNETTNEVIGLVQEFALTLKEKNLKLFILAGNHDLPQHNIENINRSAFNILLNSKNIFHLNQLKINDGKFEYDTSTISAADFGADENTDAEFVFKHVLCFPENERIPPSDKIVKPSELFMQFKNAKYIFVGDYHRQFVFNKGKTKKLLNPGCLLRQAADMIDYEPSVLFFDFETGAHTVCPIPDDEKLVTDEYLEREERRNSRIEAFIERIKENKQVTFDFIENVLNFMKSNEIKEEIKDVILELLENIHEKN